MSIWGDWPAEVRFSTFGLLGRVRVSDSAVLDQVVEQLPPGWEPADAPEMDFEFALQVGTGEQDFHELSLGLVKIMRSRNLEIVLEELESRLQFYVAAHARSVAMVHAGVVGWQGRAIILPGYCFAGKSTLVTELLKLGATYHSDEYAVVDANGAVHPYARRLRLRCPDGELPRRCSAADFGAPTGSGPLPVGLVAVAKYRANDCWRPRRLTSGQAVWELLNCTLTAERQPETALNALQMAVAGATCWKGFRGEATETAALLLDALSAHCPGTN